MQVLPAQVVAAKLLQNPAQLSLLCSSLQECFAFDPAAAGLLLYATADAGPHLSNPAAQPLSDSLDDLSSSTMVSRAPAAAVAGDTQGSGQHTGALDALWPQQGSLSAPMLPRMPAGLAHAGSQQCYEALAAVARSIGLVAYQSGLPSVLPLHSLLRHTYQDYTYAPKIAVHMPLSWWAGSCAWRARHSVIWSNAIRLI